MSQAELDGEIDALLAEEIELSVPGRLERLPLLRLMAEGVATAEDFDLDSINDIKIAVDEVASWLMHHADLGTNVTCRYRLIGAELSITLSAPVSAKLLPSSSGFGWHVVRTLTDAATCHSLDGPPRTVQVELLKIRQTETR